MVRYSLPGLPPIPPGGWPGVPRGAALYLYLHASRGPWVGPGLYPSWEATVWLDPAGAVVRVNAPDWPQDAPAVGALTTRALDYLTSGIGPAVDGLEDVTGEEHSPWMVEGLFYAPSVPGEDGWDPWTPSHTTAPQAG